MKLATTPLSTILAHSLLAACLLDMAVVSPAFAQAADRDAIADILDNSSDKKSASETDKAKADPDARAGERDYENAKALMNAIDAVLKDAAQTRADANRLPSRDEYILPPLWTETREDRDGKIKELLNAALAIVTDVEVVEIQKKIESLRRNIRELDDQNAELKERQLLAPKEKSLTSFFTETQNDIAKAVEGNEARIARNKKEIAAAKTEVADALAKSGIELEGGQVDLLLDSVLSGDLVRLVAVFNAAKQIDHQLARRIAATGENMTVARKYFAMHAALFAMLVHAQDSTIAKIDTKYIPKLEAIMDDLKAARRHTQELLGGENRPDQQRALKANLKSQKTAFDAANAYRRYLHQQREQIAIARRRAAHDLRIADNTYETVEASVQLRNLMRESAASFEAIQKLESPSFDQIFRNDELRKEFENLTRRLNVPTS